MPLRKKMVTGMLTSVGENHRSEPSADHISMHFKGTESLGQGDYGCHRRSSMFSGYHVGRVSVLRSEDSYTLGSSRSLGVSLPD